MISEDSAEEGFHASRRIFSTERDAPDFVIAEQVRALYLQAPISNLTVIALSTFYFFVLHARLSFAALLMWTLAMWGTAGYRLFLWFQRKRDGDKTAPSVWLQRYTRGSFAVGCAWSLLALFFGDMQDLVVVASICMLLLGVTASAVAVLSAHPPAFALNVYPQLTVMAAMFATQGIFELQLQVGSLCLYGVMLTLFARNAHRMFRSHVDLGNRNQILVDQLNAENLRREDIIRTRTEALRATNQTLQAEITERKKVELTLLEQEESLRRLANHDALTGLPNRLLVVDRLDQAIRRARRANTGLAVLFLDLDHFKEVNDSLGHTAGDILLKGVASRLVKSLRQADTVARLGGDEFVVIAEDVRTAADAAAVADMIQNTFKEPMNVGDGDFCITPSIGISLYPADGTDTETLLRNADAAMYRAKADGRHAYRFYDTGMTERARERLGLEGALRRALEREEFRLVFQPQLDLKTGRLIGAEALIRWQHPTEGLLAPGRFIDVAEATGQIEQIGAWVLHEACRQLKRWEEMGLSGLRLAVNVSGRQVLQGRLVEAVQSAVDASGCRCEDLELEITEGFLIRGPEASRAVLEQIREMGIPIAIDDFGTGYSSLSYLKQFPISKIKIDRAFVRDITVDPNDQAIVRAILALGRSLGLGVLAEGVETIEQEHFLVDCGCDEAQGYLYSKPLTERDFLAYTHVHGSLAREPANAAMAL